MWGLLTCGAQLSVEGVRVLFYSFQENDAKFEKSYLEF
jgi:hypothetical protein